MEVSSIAEVGLLFAAEVPCVIPENTAVVIIIILNVAAAVDSTVLSRSICLFPTKV